jgi:hypothetical protein
MNSNIKSLPGYIAVSHLIPDGHFLNYSNVWSAKQIKTLTTDGELCDGLYIVLANHYSDPTSDMIEICCLSPKITTWPNRQITGLDIKLHDMRKEHGWETDYYEIYDYECSSIMVRRNDIRLNLASKDDAINDYRQWI